MDVTRIRSFGRKKINQRLISGYLVALLKKALFLFKISFNNERF